MTQMTMITTLVLIAHVITANIYIAVKVNARGGLTMAECIEREAVSADGCDEVSKIKTPFAWIIVNGTADKPYYSILWWDTEKKECNVGYSSYYLEYVFNWLKENFEITEEDADVAPVRHGRWEKTADGAALCTACKRKMNPYQYGYAFCGLCGAKMDGGKNDA